MNGGCLSFRSPSLPSQVDLCPPPIGTRAPRWVSEGGGKHCWHRPSQIGTCLPGFLTRVNVGSLQAAVRPPSGRRQAPAFSVPGTDFSPQQFIETYSIYPISCSPQAQIRTFLSERLEWTVWFLPDLVPRHDQMFPLWVQRNRAFWFDGGVQTQRVFLEHVCSSRNAVKQLKF